MEKMERMEPEDQRVTLVIKDLKDQLEREDQLDQTVLRDQLEKKDQEVMMEKLEPMEKKDQ